MRKSAKFVALGAASIVIGHLILDAIRSKMEQVYRHAAGESDYERAHPRNRKPVEK